MKMKHFVTFLVTLASIAVISVSSRRISKRQTIADPVVAERIPQLRQFVGPYSFDVGTCPVKQCYIVKEFTKYIGYVCPVTETRKADLGVFGTMEYKYVTKCVCCIDNGIKVRVNTLDSETREPLGTMLVLFGASKIGYTDKTGWLESVVKSATRRLVVRAQDPKYGKYLEAVKVVDIPEGFRGPVEVKLLMIRKAEVQKIDSAVDNKIELTADSGNVVGVVSIEKGTFTNQAGDPYEGAVLVSLTVVDSNAGSEDRLPGQFLTPEGRSVENLISGGIFAFDFKDTDGNAVIAKSPIKVSISADMRLWTLNSETGLWEPVQNLSERGKRQVSLNEFLLTAENSVWVNIDKIPNAPRCYFKGRIFDQTTGLEITSSPTSSFRPYILAYTNQNQRLRMYAPSTYTPSVTCYEVRCPDVSNPNDALVGFINMTSTDIIDIGGVYLPYVSYLPPKDLNDYIPSIQTSLSAVQYAIAPNGLDVFANFVSSPNGPFYTSQVDCENTNINEAAFHFFKPQLPSYVPSPDDTDICTARILFKSLRNFNFYAYIVGLSSLPSVTAISVWEQGGQTYYFTDTVQLQMSFQGGQFFVYACIKYRCSETNSLTTVYLDIDVPNSTYFYQDQNGQIQSYTYPAFYCYGPCSGPYCQGDVTNNNNVVSIEGSFEAPANVSSGPDFFDSGANDCADRSISEAFAYTFSCYRKM